MKKKRKSGDWKGDPSKFKKLKTPLRDMKQRDIKREVPYRMKFFNEGSSKYGVGNNYFWEQRINISLIRYAKKALLNNNNKSESISLSDYIDWNKFTIKSFGEQPPSDNFKIKVSWTHFMLLVIELGFITIGLDPNQHVENKIEEININNEDHIEPNDKQTNDYHKRIRTRSSDDFLPTKSYKPQENTTAKPKIIPVFKTVTKFSDLPDQTVLQVTAVISPHCNDEDTIIHLSDGEYWVSSLLNKVTYINCFFSYLVLFITYMKSF